MKVVRYKKLTVAVLFSVAAAIIAAAAAFLSSDKHTAKADAERAVYFYSDRDNGELIASTTGNPQNYVYWKSTVGYLPLKPETKDGAEGAYRFVKWVYSDGSDVTTGSNGDAVFVPSDTDVNIYATYDDVWRPFVAEVQKAARDPVKYTLLTDAFEHNFGYGATVKLIADAEISGGIDVGEARALDLNGKTLSSSGFTNDYMLKATEITEGFVIRDGSAEKTGTITGAKAGVVFHNDDKKTLTIEGGTFTGNAGDAVVSVCAGDSAYYAGKVVIADGCSITNNAATGVKVTKHANFEMTGGSISGNTSSGSGGGVYFGSSGSFAFSGGRITGNGSGSNGGGIYIDGAADATMSDEARVADNVSYRYGGGIYVDTPCSFVMTGGVVEGNSVTYDSGSGGGVYVSGGEAVFDMRGGVIRYNTSEYNGGGLYVDYGGTFKMSGGAVEKNNVGQYRQGGVAFSTNLSNSKLPRVEISGGAKISGNVRGGEIVKDGETYTLTGGDKSNVYLYSVQQTIRIVGELTDEADIGVYNNYTNSVFTSDYKTNNASGSGGGFSDDKGKASGANLCNGELTFADVYTVTFDAGGAQTSVDVISGDRVSYTGDQPAKPSDGGGEYFFDGWTESADGSGSVVSLNSIKKSMTLYPHFNYTPYVATVAGVKYADLQQAFDAAAGGTVEMIANAAPSKAITVTGTATLDLKGFTVDRGLSSSTANGSVIKVDGGSLTIKDTSVDKNGSITGGYTSGNADESGSGGGVYVKDGALALESGNISGNSSTYYGGGVCIVGGTFTMTGGSVSSNTANYYGGGVYVSGGTFTMTGGSISSNTAKDNGGGAYIVGGTFTVTGGSVSSNTAACRGGGVYVKLDGGNGKLELKGGVISSNQAKSNSDAKYGGGGVYIDGGEMTFSSGEIVNNGSYMSGGGIMLYSGASLTMTNGKIANNELVGSRTQYAGGVYLFYGCEFTMSGGEIADNDDNGVRLQYNGSTKSNSFIMTDGAKIAGSGREGIFVNGGSAVMRGGSVEGNSRGGVYILSGEFDMRGGSVGNNLVYSENGGIYAAQGINTELKISGGATVKDNYYKTSAASIVKQEDGSYTIRGGTSKVNVYLPDGKTINVAGALTGGDNSIGVTYGSSSRAFAATKNYKANNPSGTGSEFFYDTTGKVKAVAGGEVGFDQAYTVKFMDGDTELKSVSVLSGGSAAYGETVAQKTESDGVYTFEKWVTQKGGDTEADLNNVTSDMTVYAEWSFAPFVAAIGEDKYADLTAAVTAVGDGRTVKLLAAVALDTSLGVSKRFTLDLNGFTLTGNGGESVIRISSGGDLTVTDESAGKNGGITGGGGGTGGGAYITTGGALTLAGGKIFGNSAASGGGVYVYGGAFTMTGGGITGNAATAISGGGVCVCSGTFAMSGGSISGNSSSGNGGGVYVKSSGGRIELSGAVVIDGNTRGNKSNNVCLTGALYITGALKKGTDNARIGLYEGGVPITSGYGEHNKDEKGKAIKPSTYFVSDNASYCIQAREEQGLDTEVKMGGSHSYEWSCDAGGATHSGVCSHCGAAVSGQAHTAGEGEGATCTKKAVCSVCHSEFGSPLGHSFGDASYSWSGQSCTASRVCATDNSHTETETVTAVVKTVAATCTSGGYEEWTATFVNGAFAAQTVRKNETVARGHTEVVDIAVAPTCTEKGKTAGKHCSVCNKVLIAQTDIAARGHSYGEWAVVTSPTCTAAGMRQRVCAHDGSHIESEEIAAKGHTEVVDNAVAPTCTESGKTAGKHCSVCNEVLIAQTDIAARGHSYGEWTVVTSPTCTTAGMRQRVCAHDGSHIQSEEIAALGHSFGEFAVDEAPTCTRTGVKSKHCSVCGERSEITEIAMIEHSLTHNEFSSATAESDGNIEFWECGDCGKYFADGDGETEITDKSSVIIPKPSGGGIADEPSDRKALYVTLIVGLSTVVIAEIAVIAYRARRKFKAKGKK